jgi:hypothetical protein
VGRGICRLTTEGALFAVTPVEIAAVPAVVRRGPLRTISAMAASGGCGEPGYAAEPRLHLAIPPQPGGGPAICPVVITMPSLKIAEIRNTAPVQESKQTGSFLGDRHSVGMPEQLSRTGPIRIRRMAARLAPHEAPMSPMHSALAYTKRSNQ